MVQPFISHHGETLIDGESPLKVTVFTFNNSILALVTGFVDLPSYMIPDSTEVLFELINFAKEVVFL